MKPFVHQVHRFFKEVDLFLTNMRHSNRFWSRCSSVAAITGRLASIALVAVGMAAYGSVSAAERDKQDDIEARYQRERAVCESGQSPQDRATCLQEAAAARDAARRDQLTSADSSYEKNALARCDALPPHDRDLCQRRVRGEGVTKGSVSEGGIYREYREVILPPVTPQGGAAPANKAPEPSPGGAAQSK